VDRIQLLTSVLDSTFDKESWYAPLKDGMEGITAEQARWKPPGEDVKSVWENVNHLIYYKERLVAKLDGHEWTQHLSGDENFQLTEQSGEDEEWRKVVERAVTVHLRLRKKLSEMTVEELDQQSLEAELLDIFLHDAYHTGQIIQVRKMQGSWPSRR
jgi:uncharacterized damage-inducible protein DinB